jgi:glycerophosphoryl diester phosphodiesterase
MFSDLPLSTILTTRDRPLIGAHRGANKAYPENTLPAFHAALAMGADFVELDVQLSKDNIVAVIHDDTIDRTTTGNGPVAGFTMQQIQTFGEVPTLEDVFSQLAGRIYFNIELKANHNNAVLVKEVLRLVSSHNLEEHVIISSFEQSVLTQLRKRNDRILTGILYENRDNTVISYALQSGADAIHPYYRLVDRKLIAECEAAGLIIIPWTVDRTCMMRYFQHLNVHAIITNSPDQAVKLHYSR